MCTVILRLGNIQIGSEAVQKLRPAHHRLPFMVSLLIIVIPIAFSGVSIAFSLFLVVLYVLVVVGALRATAPWHSFFSIFVHSLVNIVLLLP